MVNLAVNLTLHTAAYHVQYSATCTQYVIRNTEYSLLAPSVLLFIPFFLSIYDVEVQVFPLIIFRIFLDFWFFKYASKFIHVCILSFVKNVEFLQDDALECIIIMYFKAVHYYAVWISAYRNEIYFNFYLLNKLLLITLFSLL